MVFDATVPLLLGAGFLCLHFPLVWFALSLGIDCLLSLVLSLQSSVLY